MVIVPSLLIFVTLLFCNMPGMWKACHHFGLGWLIGMQALLPGWKTLADLARWTPLQVMAWHFRRLLKAAYWDIHLLVAWRVQEALNTLPLPEDGISTSQQQTAARASGQIARACVCNLSETSQWC
jgi:hypothetical protein